VDTNSAWLSRELTALGLRVAWHTTVSDRLEELVQALAAAAARASVVVLTGGLGPTEDDLTREALARAAGVELEFRPELWEHIQELFRRRGRSVPEQNRRQALLPRGAEAIANPEGTAPGVAMQLVRPPGSPVWLFALPGVPAEMRQMWPEVQHRLRAAGLVRGVVEQRTIRVFGPGESDLQQQLPGLFARGRRPEVGITVSEAVITLRILARGASREECLRQIEPTWRQIHQVLGPQIFGYDQDELQHALARLLQAQKLRLATLEWGTLYFRRPRSIGPAAARSLCWPPALFRPTKCRTNTPGPSTLPWHMPVPRNFGGGVTPGTGRCAASGPPGKPWTPCGDGCCSANRQADFRTGPHTGHNERLCLDPPPSRAIVA